MCVHCANRNIDSLFTELRSAILEEVLEKVEKGGGRLDLKIDADFNDHSYLRIKIKSGKKVVFNEIYEGE